MLSLFCPYPVQNNENVQPLFMYTAHNDTHSDDLSERENKTP